MGRAKEKVLALLLLEKHLGGKERMPKKRVSILLENISTAYGNKTLPDKLHVTLFLVVGALATELMVSLHRFTGCHSAAYVL